MIRLVARRRRTIPDSSANVASSGWICVYFLLVAFPAGSNSSVDENTMNVVIYPGNVITIEPGLQPVDAIAVTKKIIVGLGTVAELQEKFSDHNVLVDERFVEKTILPGFIDNHLHPSMSSVLLQMRFITAFDWKLPDRNVLAVRGRKDYLSRLHEIVSSTAEDDWVLSWGYHPLFHGKLTRIDLDKVSTARPIAVWHRSFHEVYLNTAALTAIGLSEADVAHHPHVDFENGHFFETGLPIGEAKILPRLLEPKNFQRGLQLMRETVHRGGITTIGDMAAGLVDFEKEWPSIRSVLGTEETPFRTLFVPAATNIGGAADSAKSVQHIDELLNRSTDKLRFLRQVKLFADGAFFSQLMQLGEPGYLDGHSGEWITEPNEFARQARRYWDAGIQIHVHVNGDKGVDMVLDVLEGLLAETPRIDHRFSLHHLGYSTEAQSRRMAELGAYVSANPYYLYALADAYAVSGLGEERAQHIFRGGSLVDAGVPLSLHSDFSMAPAAPLTLASIAVNRISADGKVWGPELRLSVEDALRSVTIEAARLLRLEEEIGSLQIGKKADFTVLEEDPFSVLPEDLHSIQIWGTVFEGKQFPITH